MGILTILWEKWVEFRRDFYKITLAAMIAPFNVSYCFRNGNTDLFPRGTLSELPDPRSRFTDYYERKF